MDIKEGIIVCSDRIKTNILKEVKGFKKYTFYNLNQIKEKMYGEVKKDAYFLLMNKYSLSYDIACEYINYMPYVDDKFYGNVKLDSIVTAKNYLIKNNLYINDELFKIFIKNKSITFIDIKGNKLINKINNYFAESEVLFYNNNNFYQPLVFEFDDIYLEALYVMNSIFKLKRSGVNLNKIHILNMDSEYEFLFKRMSISYNIPIRFNEEKGILSFNSAQNFLHQCSVCSSFNEVINNVEADHKIIDLIVECINEYGLYDEKPSECIELLKKLFKEIKIEVDYYDEMVSTIVDSNYNDDEYVFFVGANLGSCPKIYKDEEYLNDLELDSIGYLTSYEKNIIENDKIKELFLTTKNIYISYKLKNGSNKYLPSNLIETLGLKVVNEDVDFGVSKLEDNLRIALAYTNYIKYNVEESALDYDMNSLKFNQYNNSFKGVNIKLLNDYFIEKPLKLSYSSIKIYYLCPFYYYLDKILGLNEFKSTLATRIGSLSHYVLEKSYDPDFNFNDSFNEAIEKYVDNENKNRDIFFFMQMKKVLASIIEYNKKHECKSSLTNIERELYIETDLGGYSFIGFVDKLMYTQINNEIYAAIIDYKTGKDVISLDNISDGFNLQLPIYMYLLSKHPKFEGKKIHIIGIYLQKVNLVSFDNTLDLNEQLEKSFRLKGYSIKDGSILSLLDSKYYESDYIQSMAVKKDGNFPSYAKVITDAEIDKLINIVNDLIIKASNAIKQGDFSIAPKRIEDNNVSCTYCNYKDICFKRYIDEVSLPKKDFFETEVE